MKKMMDEERHNHGTERRRREEDFRKSEEKYKTQLEKLETKLQDEKQRREEEDEKRKETEQNIRDQCDEQIKREKKRIEREKDDLQAKQKIEMEKMKTKMEEESQNHDSERRRREEEIKGNEEQYRKKIKEQEEQMQNLTKQYETLTTEIQNEKYLREEQYKIYEDKIKLIEQQKQDELRLKQVNYEEDRKKDMENMNICCSQTASSPLKDKTEKLGPRTDEQLEELYDRLELKKRCQDKMKTADILQITKSSFQSQEPQEENELMAVFHCADGLLKQPMVTKLSQCQYSLPLLVPDPFTQQIEFPLWTFRQISKSWKKKDYNNEIISQTQPVYKAETPMVAFFRFGSVSSSKSQLINGLINEKHNTFFHRNCSGSSRTRLLMDGVVEIA
ncbi:unnamed protein product [Leuciscus chuanchicus]